MPDDQRCTLRVFGNQVTAACDTRRDLVAEVRALTAQLDAAHELVRASGALLCDYREERGIWWDGFREALAGLRSSLGLTPDLTDTDLRAATADLTPQTDSDR